MAKPHYNTHGQHGFSLVEMAIVLSIIALLVGGVLVGKNMVRSSQVQATVARVQQYRSATDKFMERYLELPGDFQTASTYWSGAYDGNGDGNIGGSLNNSCQGNYTERWAAWEHLAKAGLIEGQYNHTGGSIPTPGVNTPATPIPQGGYTLSFCGDISSGTSFLYGPYGHVIQVGHFQLANGNPVTGATRGALFTPKEAGAIDGKLDDAMPGTGMIKAPQKRDSTAPDCTTSNSASSADYDYSRAARSCPLFFRMGF